MALSHSIRRLLLHSLRPVVIRSPLHHSFSTSYCPNANFVFGGTPNYGRRSRLLPVSPKFIYENGLSKQTQRVHIFCCNTQQSGCILDEKGHCCSCLHNCAPFSHFHSSSIEKTNHKDKSRKCWKCSSETDPKKELFFCVCGVVQKPAKDLTYFDLLNIEDTFDINLKELGQIFRQTQMKLHPDKYSNKSKEEQCYSEEQSSLLNKAYFTLLKPLSRAIYMLQLAGLSISENDSFTDPEFLMEIMNANEEISSASSSSDVDSLEASNQKKIDSLIEKLSELFKAGDIENAKNTTIRLRYFTTVEERIKELRRGFL